MNNWIKTKPTQKQIDVLLKKQLKKEKVLNILNIGGLRLLYE